MMSNPLILARLKKKAEKASKKDKKAAKKMAKKEKKAMKKAKKAAKKAGKGSDSSSSSSAPSADAPATHRVPVVAMPAKKRERSRSAGREGLRQEKALDPNKNLDIKALGPNVEMVSKREEYAARVAER